MTLTAAGGAAAAHSVQPPQPPQPHRTAQGCGLVAQKRAHSPEVGVSTRRAVHSMQSPQPPQPHRSVQGFVFSGQNLLHAPSSSTGCISSHDSMTTVEAEASPATEGWCLGYFEAHDRSSAPSAREFAERLMNFWGSASSFGMLYRLLNRNSLPIFTLHTDCDHSVILPDPCVLTFISSLLGERKGRGPHR